MWNNRLLQSQDKSKYVDVAKVRGYSAEDAAIFAVYSKNDAVTLGLYSSDEEAKQVLFDLMMHLRDGEPCAFTFPAAGGPTDFVPDDGPFGEGGNNA